MPATTFFEHKDLQTAYGHYYLQVSNQAIEPFAECRSNVELFRSLAHRMGYRDACFSESVDEMIDKALDSPNPWLKSITRARLEQQGHVRLHFSEHDRSGKYPHHFLPFAQGGFHTPSGKAELYNATLAAQDLDPVVAFTPPIESRHGAAAKEFPLELLVRKADNFLNSTFSNLPSVQAMEETGVLRMHSRDARARGIRSGDPVHVFNHRGEILLRAEVDGVVQPGVVAASLHWAKLSPGGRISTSSPQKNLPT